MKNNITIKEIAEMADTSVSTVSRVLNNSPSVSKDKRERIKKVIANNNFQPNLLARGMVSNKTQTLAVVVSDINNPYFTDLISQIEIISRKNNYTLLLINTMTANEIDSTTSIQLEINAFKNISERHVDGVLLLGGEIDRDVVDKKYLKALNELNEQIPVVIIGQKVKECKAMFVERDQFLSAELITQHLLALGHRKIAFIGGEPGIKITTQRLNSFKKVMNIYSQVDDNLIVLNDYYSRSGYEGMNELFDANKTLPDAVVTINDRVAWGVFRSLQDHGLKSPDDIAVGSCDSFPNGEFMVPRITTVNQHNEFLGKIALHYLFQLMNHEVLDNTEETHFPELIIRESCGAKKKVLKSKEKKQ